MTVKIGVIGAGYFGQQHVRIFSELGDSYLVAIADIDKTRADELAAKYNCKSFSDYKDILTMVDAISIVTPTTTHKEIAIECLKSGKHLFIEKPITSDLDESEMIINEANRRGLLLQIGHLERYNSGVMKLADFIKSPEFIESERLSPFQGRGIDVDITLDLMIHDIDIILSLTNSPVKSIRAVGADVLTDKIDVAKAWIEFESGLSSLVTSNRLSREKKRVLKVFQKESFLLLDFQSQSIRKYSKRGMEITSEEINPAYKEPLREELKDFINCIMNGRKPLVTGMDGHNALKVALQISDLLRSKNIT